MKIKKMLSLVLAGCLALGLTACGGSNASSATSVSASASNVVSK